jgi:hypothetical protein
VAGTERGVTDPEATFSTCFGAPFMPRHPSVYGNLLRSLIAEHDVSCWLVNTGWTGGKYGVGQRMPINVTRRLLTAALDGTLKQGILHRPLFWLPGPCRKSFSIRWRRGARFVYYAGHGVEIGGTNYLVPTDARLARDYDVEDEAVALDRIIWALQSVKRLRLIILDACRDNPFPARLRSVEVRAIAGGGLSQPLDVGADTLVAYAAKAGSKSFDGDGPNSPYATALLRHLGEPGLDIRIALGRVRDDVLTMTGGRQEPFIYGSLGGATIALVAPPAAKRIEAPAATVGTAPKAVPAAVPAAVSPQPVTSAPATVGIAPKAVPVAVPAAVSPQPVTQPPAPAQEALDPAAACRRDEQRLAQLRTEPARDQIVRLGNELACPRLRSQVQRLLESVGAMEATGPPRPKDVPGQQQAAARAAPDVCARDGERLQRLRAEPNLDEIRNLERELACEQLRQQLLRLRESVGP